MKKNIITNFTPYMIEKVKNSTKVYEYKFDENYLQFLSLCEPNTFLTEYKNQYGYTLLFYCCDVYINQIFESNIITTNADIFDEL
jgi:hypothetical protein